MDISVVEQTTALAWELREEEFEDPFGFELFESLSDSVPSLLLGNGDL